MEFTPISRYGIIGDGSTCVLVGQSGYRYSKPVRVGNAAADQHQGDIYGTVIQGIYETIRYGESLDKEGWGTVEKVVEYVYEIWDEPGEGIWEFRDEPRHHVHSKLMCWVGLDRGIEIAEMDDRNVPTQRWRDV